MPQRHQLKRTKGWRKPGGSVCVARPTKWGNPFTVTEHGQQGAVEAYARWLYWGDNGGVELEERREWIHRHIEELRGKDLLCWCRLDQPCHADVLLEMANG